MKKAKPPLTRDVSRDSGTNSANGGWLRRLVRLLVNVKWTLTMLNHLKMVTSAQDTEPNRASTATVVLAWPRQILCS